MRNFPSDHFALRAWLLRRPTRCHACYLWGSILFPLILPHTPELIRAGAKFQTLKTLETVPPKLKRPPRPLCISPDSTRLIDKHAALHRNPRHNRNVSRELARAVRRSLMVVSQRRAEEAAGVCLGTSIGGSYPCGAYSILKH